MNAYSILVFAAALLLKKRNRLHVRYLLYLIKFGVRFILVANGMA